MTANHQVAFGNHLTCHKTWLFVPATMIDRVPKAFASGADRVIVDLEDAVANTDKAAARDNINSYCHSNTAQPIWVRINSAVSRFAQSGRHNVSQG